MRVQARLVVAAVQLMVLLLGMWLIFGDIEYRDPWFSAGVLMVVLSRQLNEPYFSRPADAVTGCVTSLVVVAAAPHDNAQSGWVLLACYLASGVVVSVAALALGANRATVPSARVGQVANQFVQIWQGRVTFSLTFLVAAFQSLSDDVETFWRTVGLGAVVLAIGSVRWDRVFRVGQGSSRVGQVVGVLAPSRLLISAPSVPAIGAAVQLGSRHGNVQGHVVGRTVRTKDVWCEVEVGSASVAEQLIASNVSVEVVTPGEGSVLGAVEAGSNDQTLVFIATTSVEVGTAVAIRVSVPEEREVLYQVTGASVMEERPAKDAHHQVVKVIAEQLGFIDATGSLLTHRWSPSPGSLVRTMSDGGVGVSPPGTIPVGVVVGSQVPVHLDLELALTGHLAILGMTKMGKTTLAVRLAEALGTKVPVTVLDQTGEYVKRGVPVFTADSLNVPGVTVSEVDSDTTAPQLALKALKHLEQIAREEYNRDEVRNRVLLIEEAHQFVPEPALLGFNAPGRDEAMQFGLLMMQVRKYGISVVLVSQRTAVVAKSALSQCENYLAFRSVDQTGLDYLEAVGGPQTRRLVPRLRQGELVAIGPAISSDNAVAVTLPRPQPAE